MRLLYAVKVCAGCVEIFTDTQKPTTLLKYGNETLSDIHIICKVTSFCTIQSLTFDCLLLWLSHVSSQC